MESVKSSNSKARAWKPNCVLISGRAVSQPKDIAVHSMSTLYQQAFNSKNTYHQLRGNFLITLKTQMQNQS